MTTEAEQRHEKAEFQQILDDTFPSGALCVEFAEHGGRLKATGVEILTGRIICTEARRRKDRTWRHQIVLDSRRRSNEAVNPYMARIDDLRPHPAQPDLWEAPLETEDHNIILRLNASPKAPWRPTAAMRHAVTAAHASQIAETPV